MVIPLPSEKSIDTIISVMEIKATQARIRGTVRCQFEWKENTASQWNSRTLKIA